MVTDHRALTKILILFVLRVLLADIDLNGFTTKTAYRNSKLQEFMEGKEDLKGCDLVHLNVLFRHGTRAPGATNIVAMTDIHKKILDSKFANATLPTSFLNWKNPFLLKNAMLLTSMGLAEIEDLGTRFRGRFHQITEFENYERQIKIVSSSSSRALTSAQTFLVSFLQNKTLPLGQLVTVDDRQLRFFDNCGHYADSVLHDPSPDLEYIKFKRGPEIEEVIKDVQQKWKLSDVNLTAEDVLTMFSMCGVEIATTCSCDMRRSGSDVSPDADSPFKCFHPKHFVPRETSALCSLLDPSHHSVLEYFFDLEHYWTESYGKKINWIIACEVLNPILEEIVRASKNYEAALRAARASGISVDQILNKDTHNWSSFRFGHAETVIPVATVLGLFHQALAMSATSHQQWLHMIQDPEKRFSTFRVSNLSPFSGNIALELYNCPKSDNGSISDFRVQVKSNEKVVQWSWANGKSHVSLDEFMGRMELCAAPSYNHHTTCTSRRSSSSRWGVPLSARFF